MASLVRAEITAATSQSVTLVYEIEWHPGDEDKDHDVLIQFMGEDSAFWEGSSMVVMTGFIL